MSRMAPIFVVALVLAIAACTSRSDSGPSGGAASSTPPAAAGEKFITLEISGMSCGVMCPPKVQSALEGVAGVEEVTVDFEKKEATVKAKAATVDPQKLLSALEGTGTFKGKLKG